MTIEITALITAMNLNSQHSIRLLAKLPIDREATNSDVLIAAREIVAEDKVRYDPR